MGTKNNHEDVEFSYVVIRRGLRNPNVQALHWPRLVLPPLKRNKHVILDICTNQGKCCMFTHSYTRDH